MIAALDDPPFSFSSFTAFLIIEAKGGCDDVLAATAFLGVAVFFGVAAGIIVIVLRLYIDRNLLHKRKNSMAQTDSDW